jgi:hypothetical protein
MYAYSTVDHMHVAASGELGQPITTKFRNPHSSVPDHVRTHTHSPLIIALSFTNTHTSSHPLSIFREK